MRAADENGAGVEESVVPEVQVLCRRIGTKDGQQRAGKFNSTRIRVDAGNGPNVTVVRIEKILIIVLCAGYYVYTWSSNRH